MAGDFDAYAGERMAFDGGDFEAGGSPQTGLEDKGEAEGAQAQSEEEAVAAEDDDEALDADASGWSSRTKQILDRVKTQLAPASRRGSRGSGSCAFEDILPDHGLSSAGKGTKKHLRRDAARSFFECLVLNSKGYINLSQEQAFGQLTLTPRELLSRA